VIRLDALTLLPNNEFRFFDNAGPYVCEYCLLAVRWPMNEPDNLAFPFVAHGHYDSNLWISGHSTRLPDNQEALAMFSCGAIPLNRSKLSGLGHFVLLSNWTLMTATSYTSYKNAEMRS
jgi:hypothetical protein